MRVSIISVSIDPKTSLIEKHPFIVAVKTTSPADEERNFLNTEDATIVATVIRDARTAKRQLRGLRRVGRIKAPDPRVPKSFLST